MINNNTRKPVLFYLMKFLVLFIILSSGNEVDGGCDVHLFFGRGFPKIPEKAFISCVYELQ